MTVYQPCYGCTQRKDCEVKNAVAKAMRGQPISKAHIRCDLPFTKFFPPGTRVLVGVWDWREEDDPGESTVPATVIGPSRKRGKLHVHLDAPIQTREESEIEFSSKWPKDVRLLDEPLAALCGLCNRPLINGECGRHEDFQ
jgi:hypothetical protein